MISNALQRTRRSTMAGVITIGLVATLGVDIAQAASGGSSAHSAAAKRHNVMAAEQAYLKSLRPIAVGVHNSVAPVSQVMNQIITPRPGDAAAARDAVIHGQARTQLHAAHVALAKLSAPAPLAADQRNLLGAVKQMESSLRAAKSLASAHGMQLYSRISAFGAGRFAAAQSHWQTALDDAYGKVHAATPPGLDGAHLGAPVSQTSWIFGADRACSRSTYKLGDIQRLGR